MGPYKHHFQKFCSKIGAYRAPCTFYSGTSGQNIFRFLLFCLDGHFRFFGRFRHLRKVIVSLASDWLLHTKCTAGQTKTGTNWPFFSVFTFFFSLCPCSPIWRFLFLYFVLIFCICYDFCFSLRPSVE